MSMISGGTPSRSHSARAGPIVHDDAISAASGPMWSRHRVLSITVPFANVVDWCPITISTGRSTPRATRSTRACISAAHDAASRGRPNSIWRTAARCSAGPRTRKGTTDDGADGSSIGSAITCASASMNDCASASGDTGPGASTPTRENVNSFGTSRIPAEARDADPARPSPDSSRNASKSSSSCRNGDHAADDQRG